MLTMYSATVPALVVGAKQTMLSVYLENERSPTTRSTPKGESLVGAVLEHF